MEFKFRLEEVLSSRNKTISKGKLLVIKAINVGIEEKRSLLISKKGIVFHYDI